MQPSSRAQNAVLFLLLIIVIIVIALCGPGMASVVVPQNIRFGRGEADSSPVFSPPAMSEFPPPAMSESSETLREAVKEIVDVDITRDDLYGDGNINVTEKHTLAVEQESETGEQAPAGAPAPPKKGGAANKRRKYAWEKYNTIEDLRKDSAAYKKFTELQEDLRYDLNFNWSAVLKSVHHVMHSNREYIGLINYVDGELQITHMEPSKTSINRKKALENDVVASIGYEQATRISKIPSLFIFHTHPIQPGVVSPLPSLHDIIISFIWCIQNQFVGSLVISEYGVIMITIDPSLVAEFNAMTKSGAKKREMTIRVLTDLCATLISVRSWRKWRLEDLQDTLRRMGVLYVIYPSSAYVAVKEWYRFDADREKPTDIAVIERLRRLLLPKNQRGELKTGNTN
jgi:hypothetical protein